MNRRNLFALAAASVVALVPKWPDPTEATPLHDTFEPTVKPYDYGSLRWALVGEDGPEMTFLPPEPLMMPARRPGTFAEFVPYGPGIITLDVTEDGKLLSVSVDNGLQWDDFASYLGD